MDKPEGTPSGRLKRESYSDFLDMHFGKLLPTYLREYQRALENTPKVPVLVGDASYLQHDPSKRNTKKIGGKHYVKKK